MRSRLPVDSVSPSATSQVLALRVYHHACLTGFACLNYGTCVPSFFNPGLNLHTFRFSSVLVKLSVFMFYMSVVCVYLGILFCLGLLGIKLNSWFLFNNYFSRQKQIIFVWQSCILQWYKIHACVCKFLYCL